MGNTVVKPYNVLLTGNNTAMLLDARLQANVILPLAKYSTIAVGPYTQVSLYSQAGDVVGKLTNNNSSTNKVSLTLPKTATRAYLVPLATPAPATAISDANLIAKLNAIQKQQLDLQPAAVKALSLTQRLALVSQNFERYEGYPIHQDVPSDGRGIVVGAALVIIALLVWRTFNMSQLRV